MHQFRSKPSTGSKWPGLLAALSGLPAALKKRKAATTPTPEPKARPQRATRPAPSHTAPAADPEQHAVAQQSPAQAERARCASIVRHGLAQAVDARGDLAPLVAAMGWAFDTDVSAAVAIEALDARAAVAGLRHHHHLAARRG